MKRKAKDGQRRSDCPISVGLEIFGDRWTLLILRDLMLKGRSTFRELQAGGEGIASNVLADRLRLLQENGIVTGVRSEADARVVTYRPTEKGLDLLPVLIEIVLWSARYEKTAAPEAVIAQISKDKEGFIRRIKAGFVAGFVAGLSRRAGGSPG